jgi:hypothetical protein
MRILSVRGGSGRRKETGDRINAFMILFLSSSPLGIIYLLYKSES